MDVRVEQSQRLFWEIARLRKAGATRLAAQKLAEMARLHEDRAIELLEAGQPEGWVDMYSAITAYGDGGRRRDAEKLIERGRMLAGRLVSGKENVVAQLDEIASWLDALRVMPSLGDFATICRAIQHVLHQKRFDYANPSEDCWFLRIQRRNGEEFLPCPYRLGVGERGLACCPPGLGFICSKSLGTFWTATGTGAC